MPDDGEDSSPALKGTREAYFREKKRFVQTRVYDGDRLSYNNKVEGPAIIEEKITTIVIPPDFSVTVTKYGNYILKTT